ncbi:MAG: DUF4157 domain-containing protein [Coleofasciculus sp. G1-WW12-02]|uniref:eCIS core domain-containing protein n=1 Tax=Coleofasciculus sp. G1-WW12-02 TaxID=3068483 RepID=UPI0032F4DBC5
METHQPLHQAKKSDILPVVAPIKSRPFVAQPKIESTRSNEEQLAQMRAQREASERLGSTLLTPESVPRTLPPLQPKLTIGQPNDPYEQEADRVARQVVDQINAPPKIQAKEIHQPMSVGQRKPSPLDHLPAQRVQRYATGGEMDASPDLESSIQRARGGGQPLDNGIRERMEGAFGADFSGVRVHTDGTSDQLNQSIQAKAFTTGQDVFFRKGAYNPGSRGGQELLAHELTHVVQQRDVEHGGRAQDVRAKGKIMRVKEDEFNQDPVKFNQSNIVSVDYEDGLNRRYGNIQNWEIVKEKIELFALMENQPENWFTLEPAPVYENADADKGDPKGGAYIVTPALEKYVQIAIDNDKFTKDELDELLNPNTENGKTIYNINKLGMNQKYIKAGYFPYKFGKPNMSETRKTIGNVSISLNKIPKEGLIVFTGGMNGCAVMASNEKSEDDKKQTLWHFQNCNSWPNEYNQMAQQCTVIHHPDSYWKEKEVEGAMSDSIKLGEAPAPIASNMVRIYPNGRQEAFGQVYVRIGKTAKERKFKSLYKY